jgi:putative restriction endonuclease
MPKAPSVPWTREHRLIALNLYCKLPFGKLHKGNPVIKQIAAKMGRTDNSLAIKLCNFASFDSVLNQRGIVGMRGASKEDRIYWDEFHANLEVLGPLSEQLLHDLITSDENREVNLLNPQRIALEPAKWPTLRSGETEVVASVKVRRGQNFFRQTILSAYGVRCAISGINVPQLLVASHIKPWCDFPEERLNPKNGLCLSSLHDSAFDAGLITIDEKFCVVLSTALKAHFPQKALEESFVQFEGKKIRDPEKVATPELSFLEFHRTNVFEKK